MVRPEPRPSRPPLVSPSLTPAPPSLAPTPASLTPAPPSLAPTPASPRPAPGRGPLPAARVALVALGLALVAPCLLLTPPDAAAQVYLVAPDGETASRPTRAKPSGATGPEGAPEDRQGVEVRPLYSLGLDNFGVLGTGRGGFGPRVWEGMSRKDLFALIEAMPVGVPSPAMNDLARRLLLSEGQPDDSRPGPGAGTRTGVEAVNAAGRASATLARKPGSAAAASAAHGADVAPETAAATVTGTATGPGTVTAGLQETGFLSLRIRKAFQMGFFEGGLSEMVRRLPETTLPPDLFLLSFRTRAVVPWDASSACELPVPDTLPEPSRDAIALFCTLWVGDTLVDRARIDAIRAARGRDSLFLYAAERLAWLSGEPVPDNPHLDALGLSLMQRWHLPLPRVDLDTLRPWQLNAVARSYQPGLQGLAAAEKARTTGALSFSALVQMYDGTDPAGKSAALTTPEGRAAFEKRIRQRWTGRGVRGPDVETIRELAAGLARLRRQDSTGWLAFADCVAAITDTGVPNPAFAPHAAEIALALFGANETRRGLEWAEIALSNREITPSARRVLRVLRALADRRTTVRTLGPEAFTFSDRAPLPLPPNLPVRIGRLQDAAIKGNRGETALRALDVLGTAGGPLFAPADVLYATLEALETAGLGDDARRLAIEALATRGRCD